MNDFPDVHQIDPRGVRDLADEVLDENGRMRVLPAAFWEQTTAVERAVFGNKRGLYSYPTVELVEYLQKLIGDRRAIEIGAGHGVLAAALGIPGTDNMHQLLPDHRRYYDRIGQAVVPYGPNVEKLEAKKAISKYRPEVVVACWVTHRYNPKRHDLGGNTVGVDEQSLIKRVEMYVHVGNDKVHEHKPILPVEHATLHLPFLFSRSLNGARENLQIWGSSW